MTKDPSEAWAKKPKSLTQSWGNASWRTFPNHLLVTWSSLYTLMKDMKLTGPAADLDQLTNPKFCHDLLTFVLTPVVADEWTEWMGVTTPCRNLFTASKVVSTAILSLLLYALLGDGNYRTGGQEDTPLSLGTSMPVARPIRTFHSRP